ncbi:MAG: amidohydrolase family protein, partial [Clostridiales bacterium]
LKKDILQQMLLRQSDNIRITTIDREYFSIQQILDNASKIYRAGVKVAMGTDSGISGLYFDKYPFEMKCMLSMGMSPLEVIRSASQTAAQLLGIERHYGTLEKGKFADLVILNQDPLVNMDALYDIHQVYKKGRLVR